MLATIDTCASVLAFAQDVLEHLAQENQIHAVRGERHVPAAPDTSRFLATQSGFIQMRRNHVSYQGMFAREYPVALAIGSLVDRDLARNLRSSLIESLEQNFPDLSFVTDREGDVMITTDDGRISVEWLYGTNFSTIGVRTV